MTDAVGNDPARTVTSTGCPGVVIERAVQVTTTELLWIQVRSDDEATAREVLDSVQTHARSVLLRLAVRPGQVVGEPVEQRPRPARSRARPDTDISSVALVWPGTANHWK